MIHYTNTDNPIDFPPSTVSKENITVDGRYNWKYQPERLIYMGKVGSWHQFAKVEEPFKVWCEVLDSDLASFEEIK